MGRFLESIRKYSLLIGAGAGPAGGGRPPPAEPARAPCQPVVDAQFGSGRRETRKRVERRPDPAQWSEDELLALHEAVALLWPHGPVTVSSLRTAIASGELAHARIAGRLYTTRAALAAMAACERRTAGDGGADLTGGVDWDAHLASLLPKRSGGRR
jgi:hypothetical protein